MRCDFVPPHLTESLNLPETSHRDAGFRAVRSSVIPVLPGQGIDVYDARRSTRLPGSRATPALEQGLRVRDWAAAARDVLKRTEFPDAVVRFGNGYANAFFDGQYMVFGEGDGRAFGDFTSALDVFAHEFGHAVVAAGPKLEYSGQSGALNEHLADVLGICVCQRRSGRLNDWRLGEEVFLKGGSAIRDMMNPGTAHQGDPQSDHMGGYVKTTSDNGGVHINSGIPNRAFALFTQALGEPSWETPLTVWRKAMEHTWRKTGFSVFAKLTWLCADQARPEVKAAWSAVGVTLSPWRGPDGLVK